ncbi:MAG TPA: hypothetical protein VI094_06540 [Propionibacteriaceae bacterium]
MVLVLGIGVQITTGVANSLAEGPSRPSAPHREVILILIASVAPVALFKLLAFVDPNTSSGAALRSGLADVGSVRHSSPEARMPTRRPAEKQNARSARRARGPGPMRNTDLTISGS